jgi:excisionase family DNA binding protein
MPNAPARPDEELLTPADAARILGLSVDMVRVLARSGRLPTTATTTRGARLFRRADVEELAAARAGRPLPSHAVQFYRGDDQLAGVVTSFLAAGLRSGAPAIVIATEPHRRAFADRLRAAGVDGEASGQLLFFDARETMSSIAPGGTIDERRFRDRLGGAIAASTRAWPRGRLRAFGEMVDLAWRDGQRPLALALEESWNRLAAEHSFSLLCAYSIDGFPTSGDALPFDQVCDRHTQVVSIESDGREIARLQQRERALEHALAERDRAVRDIDRYRKDHASLAGRIEDLDQKGREDR